MMTSIIFLITTRICAAQCCADFKLKIIVIIGIDYGLSAILSQVVKSIGIYIYSRNGQFMI